jgi:hypothetical protein
MRVDVARRGGLAGITLRGSMDTAELPAEAAGGAEAALREMRVDQPPSPPGHPDSFQYEITFQHEDGGSRCVVLDESELPEALRPLVDAALARGGP